MQDLSLRWLVSLLWLPLLAAAASAPASPWPCGAGTSIPISGAESDLSGASWNPETETLWVVRQNRQAWEFAYDSLLGNFALLRTLVLPTAIGSDIEACTQVDPLAADELYTLAEDQGRLARVEDIGGTPTVTGVWNLEALNNGHALPPETSSLGAEGLAFVPDARLIDAGFRYPDGTPFAGSTLGMGGLVFVGHQIEGRLHVFDINPDVSDGFVNHGSFLTAANEIAGLEYDRSGGLMFVWHNPSGVNSLEISDLASSAQLGKIDVHELYDTGMPSGNLEGIAVVERSSCGEFGSEIERRALFLTHDGGSPNLQVFEGFPCDCNDSPGYAPCSPLPAPALGPVALGALVLLLSATVTLHQFRRHRHGDRSQPSTR